MYTNIEQKNKSIFKTYLIYFIIVTLFVVIRILSSEGLLKFSEDYLVNSYLVSGILQIGILFLIPLFLYALFNKVKLKSVFKTCNFNPVNYKIIIMCLIFGVLAFIFNIVISTISTGIISLFGYYANSVTIAKTYEMKDFIADVILTAFLPAFCEEFTHRGILLQGTKHAGFKQAIYISSICFGLAHLNINQVFYAIALGIFLGTMAVATKSIIPSMIVHFVNNFIVVYLTGAKAFGWFGGNYLEWLTEIYNNLGSILSIILVVVLFMIVLILMALIIYFMYKVAILDKAQNILRNQYNEKIQLVGKNKNEKNVKAKEFVQNATSINFDYENMKDVLEIVLPKQKEVYKKTLKDNIFLIATIVLATIVTIFTFVWGIL